MTTYDLAVLGCGGMGAAVLFHAARSGASVVGIEQFPLVHNRGSSHGHTRIIRQAYFEHPHYVPLLLEAYDLWAELEHLTGQRLYVQTGLLQAGPADGVVVPGVLQSASEHQLTIDRLTAREASARFPMFRIPESDIAAFEYRAGYLFVEQCVAAHLQLARQHGAKILEQTRVEDYHSNDTGFEVATTQGTIHARRLVITAGAWLPSWLKPMPGARNSAGETHTSDHAVTMALKVLRKHLHWYLSSDHRVRQSKGCPLFFFENEVGCFYGFPAIDLSWGLKVAEHSGGEELTDPSELARDLDPVDLQRIEQFVQQYFHGTHVHQRHDVCMYTMTADQHFLIDTHPQDERMWIAGGFSGHGFKFASVIGKLVAAAALTGHRDPRLEFLKRRVV